MSNSKGNNNKSNNKKKMTLNKETIQQLDEANLNAVQGAGISGAIFKGTAKLARKGYKQGYVFSIRHCQKISNAVAGHTLRPWSC